MKNLRFRFGLVTATILLAILLGIPSYIYFALPADIRTDPKLLSEKLPKWLPTSHINLGLDLQGGVQFVLGVDTNEAVENKLARLGTEITRRAEDKKLPIKTAYVEKGQQKLRVELNEGADEGAFRKFVQDELGGSGLNVDSVKAGVLEYRYPDSHIKEIKNAALEQAERVVRSRVDKWGVSEPQISRRANNSILVQLPGYRNPEKAKELLGRTAQLKFKIVDDEFRGFDSLTGKLPPEVTMQKSGGSAALVSTDREKILEVTKGLVPADRELLFEVEQLAGGKSRYTTFVVNAATELTGEDVIDAFVTVDQSSFDHRPEVALKFTLQGGVRFEQITGANIKKRMAIILDDVVQSAPVIEGRISGGSARIRMGAYQDYQKLIQESNDLSLVLKSGALPATIKILEERQVGASLGPALQKEGTLSTVVGLVFVFIFMIGYYRIAGVVASVALFLNGVFLLALMALFNFSLSLPGIAGFVLTLGMAVDANVLINERIRQELGEGKTARKALENGFSRVFWTIFDSNLTSLIAAVVLLETNSSGPIRGFAVTLILGLTVSMYTALYVTRFIFDWLAARAKSEKAIRSILAGTSVVKEYKVFKFDFLGLAPKVLALGVLVIIASFGMLATKGMNWAVDFAGGTEMEVKFAQDIDSGKIEEAAKKANIPEVTIQALEGGKKQFLVRFDKDDTSKAKGAVETGSDKRSQAFQDALRGDLASYNPEILRVDFVGPQVGSELRTTGILSLFYALLGIVLYIGFRFDVRFVPSSIIKLFFDLLMTLSFYVFFQRSFDLTSIAALLTVAGYAVNDSVVIYDRIRENLTNFPQRALRINVNNAINETLARSINTSISTFMSLVGILLFASGSIWNFAGAMAVGIVSATFSSTFLATSAVVWFEGWKKYLPKTSKINHKGLSKA